MDIETVIPQWYAEQKCVLLSERESINFGSFPGGISLHIPPETKTAWKITCMKGGCSTKYTFVKIFYCKCPLDDFVVWRCKTCNHVLLT